MNERSGVIMSDYSFKEESKKMLQLLKYTRQWKQNLAVAILFYVLGIFLIMIGGFNTFLGGMYMVIAGNMLFNGYEQLFMTSYMNTSARHRYYSIDLFLVFSIISITIGYVMALMVLALKEMLINRDWDEHIQFVISKLNMGMKSGTVLVFIGIMGMILIIYYSVQSKMYGIAMIIYLVAFFGLYIVMINLSTGDEINDTILALGIKWKQINISFGIGAVIGYVFILAGAAIAWILRRAVYNRQYSPAYKKMFLRLSK